MEYKAPKLRLKKRAKKKVEVKGKKEDPFQEPIGGKLRLKKRSGNTTYRKQATPSSMNIMDARAKTKETAEDMMDQSRSRSEREMYKKLLKMK